jgi:chemotaxis protein methyltransferase CheR
MSDFGTAPLSPPLGSEAGFGRLRTGIADLGRGPSRAAPDPADTAHLVRIRDLVYQVAGIFQADSRLNFLSERCERRMKATGAGSLRDYYQSLTTSTNRTQELHQLLNEITIGETYFFRNEPQLSAFRQVVVPQLVHLKSRLPFVNLKIWSAGCSTGEEPYTLAMLLLEEANASMRGHRFEIVATDLNERSLEKARVGVYDDYAVRNLPNSLRDKYLRPSNGRYEVVEAVKKKVSFSRCNLADDARMVFMKAMDIIFCCNVLIYFEGASKRRVISHFYNDLNPGGYLYLGYSESLFGFHDDFRLVHFPGTTAYRKPETNPQTGARE